MAHIAQPALATSNQRPEQVGPFATIRTPTTIEDQLLLDGVK
jgi:hypothetical protein